MTGWIDLLYRHVARAMECLALAVTVCGLPLAIAAGRPGAALLCASVAGVLALVYAMDFDAWTPSRRAPAWLLGLCASLFLIGIVVWIAWEQQNAPIDAGAPFALTVGVVAGLMYLLWLLQTHGALIASLVVRTRAEENLDDEADWPRMSGPGQAASSCRIGETRTALRAKEDR